MSAKKILRYRFPPPLVWPTYGWILCFIAVPLGIVVAYSFLTKGLYGGIIFEWNFGNYRRSVDWLYLKISFESLKLASITTLFCLLLGYPLAYVMATVQARYRNILMILLVIPFWTNLVVRTYAIKVMFGDQGPVNQLLLSLSLIDEPLGFINNQWAVWLGMVTNYIPFMVLPIYVSIEKFDFSLMEAARDLGASSVKIFWKILLPLTKTGVITGCILVFPCALGEFLIPDLLGGARTMLLGNLITEQFLKMRDWPFGAALSILLMVVGLICLPWVVKNWNENGRESEKIRI